MRRNEILPGLLGVTAVVLMSGEAETLRGQAVLFLIGGVLLAAWGIWRVSEEDEDEDEDEEDGDLHNEE